MNNTILPPEGSAIELYNKGVEADIKAGSEAEKLKIHTLRGGSSGCHLGRGEVIGDLYKAVARYMGYSVPIPRKTQDIFSLGYANEDIWESKFDAGGVIYRADSNYPLKYDINGHPVTGRPDCVVGDMVPAIEGVSACYFDPEFGIEHKVISSCAVAAKMALTGKPKDDNFIQACHYSYKFNLPWTLVYSFYGIGAPPYYSDAKALKEMTGEGVVRPFKKEFKIGCDEGNFYYIDTDIRTDTAVTAKGIEEFYELMLDVMASRDLTTVKKSMTDIYGKGLFFDPNAYDELRLTTNMKGTWEEWLEDLEWMNTRPYVINTRKVNKKPTWNVINTATDVTTTFKSHSEAYRFMKEQG
jgi:hypothetical protein